MLMYVVTV